MRKGDDCVNIKPILFNTDMVRAILDGRKTVTRRVVRFLDGRSPTWTGYIPDGTVLYGSNNIPSAKSPYRPGDLLYVRETWRLIDFSYVDEDWNATVQYWADEDFGPRLHYLKNGADERIGWRPSIHMPKEAARIFLRVTDVRVERLQDITLEDCVKEGISKEEIMERDSLRQRSSARWFFAWLWDSTIKPADLDLYGWSANPWVWVIEFERISREEAT